LDDHLVAEVTTPSRRFASTDRNLPGVTDADTVFAQTCRSLPAWRVKWVIGCARALANGGSLFVDV
jgi:hypothetical protein